MIMVSVSTVNFRMGFRFVVVGGGMGATTTNGFFSWFLIV
jgi:hypothetical protein